MNYKNLSFLDYRNDYYSKQNHSLIDVRSTMEFRQGHVPNAINIPLHELHGRLAELDKSAPIVVICASGNRSMDGASIIAEAGFENVYNLQGGTMVWMMNGLPLDR